MKTESHTLNDLHAYRYLPKGDARYALVISHGVGGHGGIYGPFCELHAGKGVDIWSYDAPGHGRSNNARPRGQFTMEEYAQATRDFATHVKAETGLPVFSLGSSMGSGAAVSAMNCADITGAIVMGGIVPGTNAHQAMVGHYDNEVLQTVSDQLGRALRVDINLVINFDDDYGFRGAGEAKKQDSLNTWSYDFASWLSVMTYKPPFSWSENTKPLLLAVGTEDPLIPEGLMEATVAEIGGPVQLKKIEGGPHQLMLFSTVEFSTVLHAFCLEHC